MNEALVTALATIGLAITIPLLAWFAGKLISAFPRRLTRRTPSEYDAGLVAAWAPLIGWLIAAAAFALGAVWLDFLTGSGRWLFREAAFSLFVFSTAAGLRRWVDYSLDHEAQKCLGQALPPNEHGREKDHPWKEAKPWHKAKWVSSER